MLTQEIEPLADMRDACLLGRELQTTVVQKLLDEWPDFIFQEFLGTARDNEVVGISHEVNLGDKAYSVDLLPNEALFQEFGQSCTDARRIAEESSNCFAGQRGRCSRSSRVPALDKLGRRSRRWPSFAQRLLIERPTSTWTRGAPRVHLGSPLHSPRKIAQRIRNGFHEQLRCCTYFQRHAPWIGYDIFYNAYDAIVYYLPGTIGWGLTFGDRPTAFWQLPYPVILGFPPTFGVLSNGFGFTISWATNASVVVEACTNMASGTWLPVATNVLTDTRSYPANPLDGWSYFSDPDWTNHPSRFYRLRSP